MTLLGLLTIISFLLSSYFLTKKIDRGNFGTWILCFFTQILLSVEILGAFNVLNEGALFLLGLGFFLISSFFALKFKREWSGKKLSMLDLSNRALFMIFIGSIVFLNQLIPVFEIDSIGYHLPIVSQFLHTESVWSVFQAGFVGPNTYFPANHEALQTFFVLTTGTYKLNFLVTLLAFALFYDGLQSLCRTDRTRFLSFIFLMSIVSTPFLFKQFFEFQVDLFLFCLFGSALVFLIKAIFTQSKLDFFKFFLVFGLALGTKYNALLQGVVLLPILVYVLLLFKKEWKQIFWYPFASVFVGGFWYLRNFILTENPIYPFGIHLGPFVFEGHERFLSEMSGTSIFDAFSKMHWFEVFQKIASNPEFRELGFSSLILPCLAFFGALFFGVSFFLKRKTANSLSDQRFGFVVLLLAVIFILEVYAYLTSPYTFTLWNETIRYSAACFPFILILLVLLSNRIRFFAIFASGAAILVMAYHFCFSSIFSQPAYLHLFQAALHADPEKDDVFLSEVLVGYSKILPHIQKLRAENPDEEPKIALAGSTFYYLFEEEGFRPFYVNVDGCETCEYPDYRSLPESIRTHPDPKAWEILLQKLEMDYLLVGTYNSHFGSRELFEKEWAEANPALFAKLLDANGIALYKIN